MAKPATSASTPSSQKASRDNKAKKERDASTMKAIADGVERWMQRAAYLMLVLALSYRYFAGLGPALPAVCKLFRFGCPPKPVAYSGTVHPAFRSIQNTFLRNFQIGDELGSSFTAYVGGKKVVELYGGYTDYNFTVPYSPSNLQLVFSSSKAVTGIVVTTLIDKGLLDYDDPVAKHWPEFAEGGKERVTVRDLLTHRGGVAGLDSARLPNVTNIHDLDVIASIIAGQPHNFDGEPVQAYHATTRGWYLNELVRRVDPSHRSIGVILREDVIPILGPGHEFYFGLPKEEHDRVARLHGYPMAQILFQIVTPGWLQEKLGTKPFPKVMVEAFLDKASFSHKVLIKSGPETGVEEWPQRFNDHRIWEAEGPSFGGMTNSRTLARFAAFMANHGSLDGKTLISEKTYRRAHEQLPRTLDAVMKKNLTFVNSGWGVMKDVFTPNFTWTGWAGAGGSMIWWNSEYNIAFSYVMNFCHVDSVGDRRSHAIAAEFVKVVKALKESGVDLNNLPDAAVEVGEQKGEEEPEGDDDGGKDEL
ncbi:hypothetical protein HK101_000801 [Irineochytrium annulatum]|nr:hypothetical protein HK101_000801 [Irineochytrium annulatum]